MRRADYDNCGGRVLDDVFNDRVEALFVSSQHFPITPRAAKAGKRPGEHRATHIQHSGGYWVPDLIAQQAAEPNTLHHSGEGTLRPFPPRAAHLSQHRSHPGAA